MDSVPETDVANLPILENIPNGRNQSDVVAKGTQEMKMEVQAGWYAAVPSVDEEPQQDFPGVAEVSPQFTKVTLRGSQARPVVAFRAPGGRHRRSKSERISRVGLTLDHTLRIDRMSRRKSVSLNPSCRRPRLREELVTESLEEVSKQTDQILDLLNKPSFDPSMVTISHGIFTVLVGSLSVFAYLTYGKAGNSYVLFLIGVNLVLWAIVTRMAKALDSDSGSETPEWEQLPDDSIAPEEELAPPSPVALLDGNADALKDPIEEVEEVIKQEVEALEEAKPSSGYNIVDAFRIAFTTSYTPSVILKLTHVTFFVLVSLLGALGALTLGYEGNRQVWFLFAVNVCLWGAVSKLSVMIDTPMVDEKGMPAEEEAVSDEKKNQ